MDQYILCWEIELESNLCSWISWITDSDALLSEPLAGVFKMRRPKWFY
ncbi:MAG: hypothetical protein RLZZ79_402, partial [Actinomycetota bacterium]